MRTRHDFFYEQAAVLLAVVVPLALAEDEWWYLSAVIASILAGFVTRIAGIRPLLGPVASRLFVLAAFVFLLYEYISLGVIPVIALSHFMMLVCVSKFLSERSLRDDAQLAVLSLLLLVVAAIVSGNVIFLVVLLVALTVGLAMLIRFNLALERACVERFNATLRTGGSAGATGPERGPPLPRAATVSIGSFAVVVGILVFAFFPRVGAGMFGRMDQRGSGPAATGFSNEISFDTIGPISESERQVMRVKIEAPAGHAAEGEPMYFRGRVYDFYAPRAPRSWEWQRSGPRPPAMTFSLADSLGRDEPLLLLPELGTLEDLPVYVERYQLEPGTMPEGLLPSRYPPLGLAGVGSEEIETVSKSLADQNLRVLGRTPSKLLCYTLYTGLGDDETVIRALGDEREEVMGFLWRHPRTQPPVLPPEAEAGIRALIAPLMAEAGPLSRPENRERFAELVADYLRSERFTYTLSPPPPRPGDEPVSRFLLETRRGYCQHFASAMVIMCQLADVPARLVSGFRCDDFNRMGRFYSVRGKHAHAWVEVYIRGKDWIIFDPTPVSNQANTGAADWLKRLRSYGDFLQFQWATLVLTYDADTRRELLGRFKEWLLRPAAKEDTLLGQVSAFARELFTWRMVMSWQDRLLYWVFALLIVSLVVLIGYVAAVLSARGGRRAWRWYVSRWPGAGRTGDAGLYDRFCRRLADLGLRRRPEQTPAEFAADLAARFPPLAPAPGLVYAYYEVMYGQRSLSPERRRSLEDFLTRLHGLDRAALG